jgi:hypothetical protein
MAQDKKCDPAGIAKPFNAESFSSQDRFTYMGTGSLGAKAGGLACARSIVEGQIASVYKPAIHIDIPSLTVIATDHFHSFLQNNKLGKIAAASLSDEQISSAFMDAILPAQLVNDLRVFIEHVRVPLAVRSSSRLEDGMHEPFAGVYATKMIQNNSDNPEHRLQSLMAAIKHVYASTYLKKARDYLEATGHSSDDEEMAVIIQEVVGTCQNGRFYPEISGVARSFNFYPVGLSRPEEGVVDLALGLGKIIADEGVAWSFSPQYPHTRPPYTTFTSLLKQTQKEFWAIDMRACGERQSPGELEHIRKYTLADAETDGALTHVASTFEAEDEKIIMGTGSAGPRVLDFAQILRADLIPLNALIKDVLRNCEELLHSKVECEFAVTFPRVGVYPARFGFLQVRPMAVSHVQVEVRSEELRQKTVVVASESALGNGATDSIRDIVYVKPSTLDSRNTQRICAELEDVNHRLDSEGRPYVLIGCGRWGSSDPSAGIPINFAQISAARVIVEATLPDVGFIPSQGSHFFHNITSFKVLYFSVGYGSTFIIDWEWLHQQQSTSETEHVRHIHLPCPLDIRVDGRTSRGVILRP